LHAEDLQSRTECKEGGQAGRWSEEERNKHLSQGRQPQSAGETGTRQSVSHCNADRQAGILADSAREAGRKNNALRHAGKKCKGGRRFGKATQVGKQVGQGQHGSRQGDWTREVGRHRKHMGQGREGRHSGGQDKGRRWSERAGRQGRQTHRQEGRQHRASM
jgi:hypothetical protein